MSEHRDTPSPNWLPAQYQLPGVVVSQEFFNEPQGIIRDMIPNTPGMAESVESVSRDRKTGHIFVAPFKALASVILKTEIEQKPFIGNLSFVSANNSLQSGYVVDYRRVNNLMYPTVDMGYDPDIGLDSIRESHERLGTVPAIGAIMMKENVIHYISPVVPVELLKDFAKTVDNLIKVGFKTSDRMVSPAYIEGVRDYTSVDEESEES